MSTSILTIAATAGTSSTFTVTAGTPVTVGLFIAGGGLIPYVTPPLRIEIEDPNLNFTDTGFTLDSTKPVDLLIAPGVYRIRREVLSGGGVGVFRS